MLFITQSAQSFPHSLSLPLSVVLSCVKVFLCLDKILIFAVINAAETVEVIHFTVFVLES